MSNPESLEFVIHVAGSGPSPVRLLLEGVIPAGTMPVLFQLGQNGVPVVFDPEGSGEAAFRVPCRIDRTEDGEGPCSLVFVTEGEQAERRYRLEFRHATAKEREVVPLIGDGDTFILQSGDTMRDGFALPAYQGSRLYGEEGLLVPAAYDQECCFFAGNISGAEPLRFRRVLRDSRGEAIGGDVLVADLDGDGILEILACREDGTGWYYENTGTDAEPCFVLQKKCFDLIPLLQGMTMPLRLPDGTVNPVYPEMSVVFEHGGKKELRGHAVPFAIPGEQGVLVSVRGSFLLYFAIDDAGNFEYRGFARDAEGKVLDFDAVSAPVAAAGGSTEAPRYLAVTFHGRCFHLEFKGLSGGVPVFAKCMQDGTLTSLTATFPLLCGDFLLLGGQGGVIERFRVARDEVGGIREILPAGRLMRSHALPGFQALGCAVYTDLNGDGRYGLLAGNVRGRLTWYANLGTRRNPQLGGTGKLCGTDGAELKLNRGPDPNEPFDGYAKPIALRMHRDASRMDILCGSGSGEIFHWRNLGCTADGVPQLEFAGVLQDSAGNPIRCHHMSALTAAHWFGNGAPDLLVSGQCRVHAAPDDDSDRSQVRVYAGSYDDDGRLVFAPFQVIHQHEDIQFAYRPIPPEVTVSPAGGTRLRLGWMDFRRPDDAVPNEVEFAGEWLFPPVESGWLPAYAVRSRLAPGDDCYLISSCVGSLKVFRESYRRLGGYVPCRILSCTAGKLRLSTCPPPGKSAFAPPPAKDNPASTAPETPEVAAIRLPSGELELNIKTGDASPQDMLVNCRADRGPVYDDDRLEIRLQREGREEVLLMVNPAGRRCLYGVNRDGRLTAAENAGELYRLLHAEAAVLHDGWQLKLRLPENITPAGCRIHVRRCLAHYAGKIRASEQRKTLIADAAPLQL